ncbi:DUF952 domain-containing protein [Brevundimonas sp.]|uniref:DUF952 domain-containing protein n=1 Tax=Brevundimonas sp. TaxID=1871086 RepID=UPI002D6438E6|nr:DUF952 domain-containing protein [Brevundimonas sp.]HYC98255.1 DUF952 domain-containing protein [Brevundimonas sp.]
MTDLAYKLVDRAEYEAADGFYSGSAVDRADGYIHMSTAGQLAETAARHFRGRDDLLLVAVHLPDLEDLRWEPSRGGALFPHLFGPLPKAAALWERSLSVDADGIMRFDDGATGWP